MTASLIRGKTKLKSFDESENGGNDFGVDNGENEAQDEKAILNDNKYAWGISKKKKENGILM